MMGFSSSSSTGSSKRAKTGVRNINVNVSCLVDGCNSDLSQCREYHRRHKVCAVHSKTATVTIGGREQRFCQQCSRFHSLVEFDDGKRSCRKRLDGHNRRRRKPQVDSFSRSSGMFFPAEQGTTLLSFSSPQIHPSAVVSSSTWAGAVKSDEESILFSGQRPIYYTDKRNLFLGQSAAAVSYHKGVNQFQFLLGTDRFHLLQANNSNSDRALSLLSSSTPSQSQSQSQSQSRDNMGSAQMIQPGHNLQFSGLRQFPFTQEIETKGTELSGSSASNNTTLQCQGMFQNVPDGSSMAEAQQTLSFRWE